MGIVYPLLWAIITSEFARDVALSASKTAVQFVYNYANAELQRKIKPKRGTSESRETGRSNTRKPR